MHIHAAVDADRLAGHEVAVAGREKNHRADKILRILIALYWAPAALKLNEKEKCWFTSARATATRTDSTPPRDYLDFAPCRRPLNDSIPRSRIIAAR